jgi:hypothetical protein
MANSKESKQTMTIFIIGMALLIGLFNLTLTSNKENELIVREEVDRIYKTGGKELGDKVTKQATQLYTMMMIDNGLENWLDGQLINNKSNYKLKGIITELDNTMNSFGQNIKITVYKINLRLATLKEWLFALIAFWLGCIIDGFYRRKISQYELGNASAGMSRLWWVLLSFSSLAILVYILFPFSMGSATFHIPLFYILIISIGSRSILTSFHKAF